MALPVLEGIASVFGAAVPAYQQARNFVLKSQEAALDYRIAVANLITRLRTEELANAARMRSAAADAISNVRRTFELEGPVYQAVVAELINSNVPDQQQKNFLDSVRNQGYLTEDDVGYVFDLTKGDRPEDAGAGAGAGEGFGLLDPSFFEYESSLYNSRINSNQNKIDDYLLQKKTPSKWDNMSQDQRDEIDDAIVRLENENRNLIEDQRAALNSRNYLQQDPTASLAEIRELFPQSWLAEQELDSAGTGTPVVTPPPPIDTNPDFELEWDGSSPPASVFNQDRERAIRDSIMVDQAIPGLAPPIKAKQ
jgi:hypothetical protein